MRLKRLACTARKMLKVSRRAKASFPMIQPRACVQILKIPRLWLNGPPSS